jgi:hypothetical protein
MSLVTDIATYLTSFGTMGSDAAVPPTIYCGILPAQPDQLITLMALPGRKPERTMGGVSFDQPQLNAISRALTYTDSEALIKAVREALDGFSGTLSGTRYLWIEALHDPWDIGQDENDRHMFSIAFHIKKERS